MLSKKNHKIFKTNNTSPLDFLLDYNNNIFTNPDDIANEIYTQQSIINKPTVPTYYYQPDNDSECTIDKRGNPNTPLHAYFDQETYNLSLKNLNKKKNPWPKLDF